MYGLPIKEMAIVAESSGRIGDLNFQSETLKTSLQNVEHKFLDDWLHTELNSLLDQQRKYHDEIISKNNKRQAELKEQLSKIRAENTSKTKAKEKNETEIQQMVQDEENIKKEIQTLQLKNEEMKKQVTLKSDSNKKQKEVLQEQCKSADLQKKEIEKAASFYSQRLGMRIAKVSGGRVQLIFTNIDLKDVEKTFYLFFKINKEERSYEITECEPPIPDLEMLTAKLNETNDLKSFVQTVRKRFKQMV